MLQVYVKRSDKAFEFYQKAFDAQPLCSYPRPDGTLYHSELDVDGQVLAVSELEDSETVTGNAMQFCLHFGAGKEAIVHKIYDVLKDGATIDFPLGPCEWSPLMASLIDQFGVFWCIFV
jgi:PhnB protein